MGDFLAQLVLGLFQFIGLIIFIAASIWAVRFLLALLP